MSIIAMLEELSLTQYTLIDSVKNGILEEYEGHHIGRSQWDIIKMYREVIQPFHRIKINKFGLGIYSFWSSNSISDEDDYRRYLLQELERIIKTSDSLDSNSTKMETFNKASNTLNYLINNDIKISDFVLLHGDLYNGNILVNDDKYATIDFEYVRFGPSLLEWAFLLFWDALIEADTEKRELLLSAVARDIEIIKREKIVSINDIVLIFDLYLPIILCCVLHYCEEGRYEQSEIMEKMVIDFWNNKYHELRKALYEKG